MWKHINKDLGEKKKKTTTTITTLEEEEDEEEEEAHNILSTKLLEEKIFSWI